jgi:hypothetical protein
MEGVCRVQTDIWKAHIRRGESTGNTVFPETILREFAPRKVVSAINQKRKLKKKRSEV